MLIGRQKEQERLHAAQSEEESMFVAVYGRRRVGKTYLVRETFENRFTFYHTGLAKSPMTRDQIRTNTQYPNDFDEAVLELELAGMIQFVAGRYCKP